MRLIDMVGKKFGRLTVLERGGKTKSGKLKWKCLCECGNVTEVDGYNLRHGFSTSCGCYQDEVRRKVHTTHGMTGESLYNVYHTMIRRCEKKTSSSYYLYGGRGITVCEEWHSFETFRDWAYENGYKEGLSIDRIDVNKGYSPDNCRWADKFQQANNKRTNRIIEVGGKSLTLAEWARETGISQALIRARIERLGWSEEDAVSSPTGSLNPDKAEEKVCKIYFDNGTWKSANQVAKMIGVSVPTVVRWYKKYDAKTFEQVRALKANMKTK